MPDNQTPLPEFPWACTYTCACGAIKHSICDCYPEAMRRITELEELRKAQSTYALKQEAEIEQLERERDAARDAYTDAVIERDEARKALREVLPFATHRRSCSALRSTCECGLNTTRNKAGAALGAKEE